MSKRAIQIFLFLFISVFVFNQVAHLLHHHLQSKTTYYCEVTESEELLENSTRFKAFEPPLWVLVINNVNQAGFLFKNSEKWNGLTGHSRGFFPHTMHVPIFLDKCVFII